MMSVHIFHYTCFLRCHHGRFFAKLFQAVDQRFSIIITDIQYFSESSDFEDSNGIIQIFKNMKNFRERAILKITKITKNH